ncbi:unnamed protein product [Brachionus calyciflorus]|uniref:Uncharacterized protein n=1 Tax=Brachionus calyciflorus TaxID=104777 RepID=A0A814FQP3_9BILA|nr:unnamed protein product [Brachionus calyciflorus]
MTEIKVESQKPFFRNNPIPMTNDQQLSVLLGQMSLISEDESSNSDQLPYDMLKDQASVVKTLSRSSRSFIKNADLNKDPLSNKTSKDAVVMESDNFINENKSDLISSDEKEGQTFCLTFF